MTGIGKVVLQLLVTFVIAAAVMPLVLLVAPGTRDASLGVFVAAGLLLIVFGVIRLFWPSSRT